MDADEDRNRAAVPRSLERRAGQGFQSGDARGARSPARRERVEGQAARARRRQGTLPDRRWRQARRRALLLWRRKAHVPAAHHRRRRRAGQRGTLEEEGRRLLGAASEGALSGEHRARQWQMDRSLPGAEDRTDSFVGSRVEAVDRQSAVREAALEPSRLASRPRQQRPLLLRRPRARARREPQLPSVHGTPGRPQTDADGQRGQRLRRRDLLHQGGRSAARAQQGSIHLGARQEQAAAGQRAHRGQRGPHLYGPRRLYRAAARHPLRRLVVMRLGIGACLLFLGCNNVPAAPTDAASDFTIANEDAGSALDGASDFALANSDGSTSIGASVLQLHNHANRDGVYTDPLLTQSAASRVHRDKAFQGGYAQANARGPVFAQPLFVDQGGSGDFVIVTTESNDVIAFDAISGKSLWHTGSSLLGAAAPGSAFSCGDVNPSGITGTGAIDLPSRTLFFQTDTFDGSQVKHLVWALSIDDGRPRPGWPLDLATVLPNFGAPQQGERGALLILGGNVYVPLGGRYGDCVPYRGYVVGIPMTNPKAAFYFQTKVQDANGDGA